MMRSTKLILACLAIGAISVTPALAQEGHPLKGSWLGDWGPSRTDRNPVFIHMDWDGKSVTGMINPGTDNIPLQNVQLIPPPPAPAAAGGGGRGGGGGGQRGGGGGGGQAGAAGAAPAAGAQPGGGGGARGGGGAQAGAAPAAGAQPGGGGGARGGGGAQAGAAPAAGAQPGGGGGQRGGGGGGGGQAAAPAPAPIQDWMVHMEATTKDRSGQQVRYIIDGKIENLGLYNRSIVGSWSHGNVKGDFKIQRQ
jgi:hypothetical protein